MKELFTGFLRLAQNPLVKLLRGQKTDVKQHELPPSQTSSPRKPSNKAHDAKTVRARTSLKADELDYWDFDIDPESNTIDTAVGDLPISPLMDPNFHTARQRFTQRKPLSPPYKLTKFQRSLARNPYALALATPIRRCAITKTPVPEFFLQRFLIVAHPETKAPYFFPEDLESKAVDTAAVGNPSAGPGSAAGQETSSAVAGEVRVLKNPLPPKESLKLDGPTEVNRGPGNPTDTAKPNQENVEPSRSDMGSNKLAPTPAPESESKPWDDKKPGPSSYALSNQKFLQELQNPKSKYFVGYRRFFRMSDKRQGLSVMINNATWRSDMDTVILDLLRKRAVEGLCHFARLSQEQARGYIVKCERWDDVKELKHRGCLLYLGQAKGTAPDPALEFVPPRLSSMDVGPAKFGVAKLAVHNLREILGDEYLEKLRQRSTLLSDGSLFLLGRQATVNLQMLLWKIQGYVTWETNQTRS